MSLNPITKTITLKDGRTISIETGKLAKQADGSVIVREGNTMLIATVVSNTRVVEGIDYLPLSVDYREKYPAAGKFPGGFFKREARPNDHETLTSRLIDRALRPLFPSDYHSEIQVLVSLISLGPDSTPESLACLAASAALSVSDIPFAGPVSETRIIRNEGNWIINPTVENLEGCDIDMIVAGTEENIMMVEGEMSEISETEMLEAIAEAHEAIKDQCKTQKELAAEVEKAQVKREYNHEDNDEDLRAAIKEATYDKLCEVARKGNPNKAERSADFKAVRTEFIEGMSEEDREDKEQLAKKYFHDVEMEAIRRVMLDEGVRVDGRKMNEVRPIWSEVDYLPGAHGSAIFTRGETQSLTTVTLGTKMNEQLIDGVVYSGKNAFLLHYNFPPFSTGEAKFKGAVSRREVGHGNLALRALKPVLPTGTDNPYTIRVVSDILESNGSSSMATVCAGSLALMDAGVQIKKPVSGIAMGLIMDPDGKNCILSDILGDEDHLGDMDFKVTGTEDGITACQMDIKVEGLSHEVLTAALEQAKEGRLHILEEIKKTMAVPNDDYKPHTPRIEQLIIDKEFIGAVIGPGGKIIQEMQESTGAVIMIEEVDGQGIIDIVSENKESIEAAKSKIKAITARPEVGEVYMSRVKSIMPYGAFVEIMPGKEGLLHISEIDWSRLEKVEDVLKEGDEIKVKLIAIDPKSGKFKLSRKVLLPRPEASPAPAATEGAE
ncbi:MAG TPA: polyribonucleotide nucleotidyltransferase [Flavobacteriales bacterium]|nr:polyribonucleotide nucleotidyltransferase [Flavobacteriales bacterium]